MPEALYFADIHSPLANSQEDNLFEVLFKALHGFNRSRSSADQKIGWDVPQWNGKAGWLARQECFRVLGSAQSLNDFLSQKSIQRLKALGLNIERPAVVPTAAQYVQLSRDNRFQGMRPSAVRRLLKRGNTSLTEGFVAERNSDFDRTGLRISVKSESTGQNFILLIGLKGSNSGESPLQFNNYGLASKGAIPRF